VTGPAAGVAVDAHPNRQSVHFEAWTAQEIPRAGSFLGALELDALTGQCTVPATESSTVRAGEL
jgi:hypothetical protein